MRNLLLPALLLLVVGQTGNADSPVGPLLRIPNQIRYWADSGFHEMVPPLRIPTDRTLTDTIQVWLKLPETGKVSVKKIFDSSRYRYTLIYPPGTIADRVEFDQGSSEGVGDVRGARIDESGGSYFHVYETAPEHDPHFLEGYEWKRSTGAVDVEAGKALVHLYYPGGESAESRSFANHNHCANCHQPNLPTPIVMAPSFNYESDSRGFFQEITELGNGMTVRNHREWDLNADDPFIKVGCNGEPAMIVTTTTSRGYECSNNAVPFGTLDLKAALAAEDPHALKVCESRGYLFDHMDVASQSIFAEAAAECTQGR